MYYKIPAHAEIDTYLSTNPISEWHLLNVYMNSKLESNPLMTAPDLFRSFCRSLTFIEKNENDSYPKYVMEYAKKLRMTMKSKALDDITNKIIQKCKRGGNDNDENEFDNDRTRTSDNGEIEPMIQENCEEIDTSARGHNNDFTVSSFGVVWINNDGHNFSDDFWQFQRSIIEKLKIDPVLSYVTNIESIIALSSIMVLRKNKKPTYVLCTDNEWRMAFPHITYKFKIPALIQVIVCSYTQPLMMGDLVGFEELWRLNWSKVSLLEDQNDKRIFDSMQIITHNFFYNLPYGKNKNLSNKDTYVHRTCHAILEEIFHVETMQIVWQMERVSHLKSNAQKMATTA
ncbi:14887_t:CDS:2 [Entrophospora sp. SA101]|nr:14887_t:CDS:2 [Entrophospora sp. SA101]